MLDAEALERKRRERDAFHKLLDLSPAAREERLAEYERDDPRLAIVLRATLAAADEYVADDESGLCENHQAITIDHRSTIIGGRFLLTELLGIGGMGEVYLAERTDDLQQRVALKLVRSDLPVSHARARREREILARLNHPHIAGFVDAGLTDSGHPWFAMEYVEGERITDWCDRRRLSLKDRARLLARVCVAVQFAHRNLVLHRDLKPSNILIDGEGRPKLLDFGIAKLLDATDGQETRTMALTLAYAAPEQLRGEAATTASDIYQLGVILFELACGVSAREARTGTQYGVAAGCLPRPNHLLSAIALQSRPEADRIAYLRGAGRDRLRRQLGGDFARMLAKATDVDPRVRYTTAQALADDLERWAGGLSINAYRGSLLHRLSKLVRRHRLSSAAILLLSLGMTATTFIAVERTHREREQREWAERQREIAEAQRQSADEQRAHAETLLAFMKDVFREGDPNYAQGAILSASDLLANAGERLERRTDISDATRAVLLTQLAEVLHNLGQAEQAITVARRAHALLEPQREQVPVEYLQNVAIFTQICIQASRYLEAAELVEKALPLARRMATPSRRWHPYLRALRGYSLLFLARGDEAEAEVMAAIAEFDEAGDDRSQDLFDTLATAAGVFSQHGSPAPSIALYDRAMQVIELNPQLVPTSVLRTMANKGAHEYALGEVRRSIATLTTLLPQFESMMGPAYFGTLFVRSRLVTAHMAVGDYTSARDQLATIDATRATGGSVAAGVERLVETARIRYLIATGRFAEAEVRANDLLAFLQAHEQSSNALGNQRRLLAEAVLQQHRALEAVDLLRSALGELDEPGSLSQTMTTAAAEDSLGRAYLLLGEPRALAHLRRAIELSTSAHGPDKPSTLRSEIHLLWAQAAISGDAAAISELAGKRAQLVAVLNGEEIPQVRQLDLLVGELEKTFGRSVDGSVPSGQARASLARIIDVTSPPRFVGLTEF